MDSPASHARLDDLEMKALESIRLMGRLDNPETLMQYALLLQSKRKQGIGKDDSSQHYNHDKPISLPYADNSYFCGEIDPPWSYNSIGFNGWKEDKTYRIHPGYPTMPTAHMIRMCEEIKRVMRPTSCMYMWVTDDFVIDGHILMAAMGYEVVRLIHWIKCNKDGSPTYGQGYWYRLGWEGMLFGIRYPRVDQKKLLRPKFATSIPNYFLCREVGVVSMEDEIKQREEFSRMVDEEDFMAADLGIAPGCSALQELRPKDTGQLNHFFAQRTGHSVKPDFAYRLIRDNHDGPRISIFQRTKRAGFECWGNEMHLAGNYVEGVRGENEQ